MWADGARTGAIIRTMSLYSGHSDRRRADGARTGAIIRTMSLYSGHSHKMQVDGARMGAIIRTMSLYSGHSDRTRNRACLLSECSLYKLIVLIMARATRPLSV